MHRNERERLRVLIERARPMEENIADAQERLEVFPATKEHGATVLYPDGDWCAEVHDNLAYGCLGNAYAELFAASPKAFPALLQAIDTLVAHLKPLAKVAEGIPLAWPDDKPLYQFDKRIVTAGQCRAAAKVLTEMGEM